MVPSPVTLVELLQAVEQNGAICKSEAGVHQILKEFGIPIKDFGDFGENTVKYIMEARKPRVQNLVSLEDLFQASLGVCLDATLSVIRIQKNRGMIAKGETIKHLYKKILALSSDQMEQLYNQLTEPGLLEYASRQKSLPFIAEYQGLELAPGISVNVKGGWEHVSGVIASCYCIGFIAAFHLDYKATDER